VRYQLFHFFPVDFASIQPEPDPASWPNVGRHIELSRVRRNKPCIVPRQDLADETDNTVPVMIIQKVGEYLLTDIERHMIAGHLSRGSGQAEADRGESLEAGVFRRRVLHSAIQHSWPRMEPGKSREIANVPDEPSNLLN
jgi:hypothetical protein